MIKYEKESSGMFGQRRIESPDVQKALLVFLKEIFGDNSDEEIKSFYIKDGWIKARFTHVERT